MCNMYLRYKNGRIRERHRWQPRPDLWWQPQLSIFPHLLLECPQSQRRKRHCFSDYICNFRNIISHQIRRTDVSIMIINTHAHIPALVILCFIWVGLFSIKAFVFFNISESVIHQTTIASIVAILAGTIDQVLFTQ